MRKGRPRREPKLLLELLSDVWWCVKKLPKTREATAERGKPREEKAAEMARVI